MAVVADTVNRIIIEQLGVAAASVTPDAAIVDDLGADAFDLPVLREAFEAAFGLAIPDADAAGMMRVRDVIVYLEAHAADVTSRA